MALRDFATDHILSRDQIRSLLESIHRQVRSLPPQTGIPWIPVLVSGLLSLFGLVVGVMSATTRQPAVWSGWQTDVRDDVVYRGKSRFVSSAIDPHGKHIAVLDSTGSATVIDAEGQVIFSEQFSAWDGIATQIALSRSGKRVAIAGCRTEAAGLVNFVAWRTIGDSEPNAPDGNSMISFAPYSELRALRFSADETELICGTVEPKGSGRLLSISLDAAALGGIHRVEASQISALAVAPEGDRIAFAAGRADSLGSGEVFLTAPGGPIADAERILQTKAAVSSVQLSDDGKLLVAGTMAGELIRYDVERGQIRDKLRRSLNRITSVAIVGNGPDVVFTEFDLAFEQQPPSSSNTADRMVLHKVLVWPGTGSTSPFETTRGRGELAAVGVLGTLKDQVLICADPPVVARIRKGK